MDWAVQMVRAGKEIRVRWWLVRAVQKVRAVQMVRSMPMVRAVQMVRAGGKGDSGALVADPPALPVAGSGGKGDRVRWWLNANLLLRDNTSSCVWLMLLPWHVWKNVYSAFNKPFYPGASSAML
jgi:hypothetical protein